MRLPLFVLAGTLACFLSVFIPQGSTSYLSSNSFSFLSKIPLALVFISKEINAREIWVPKSVPAIMPSNEEGDGSIRDEYSEVANAFAKPGSKVIQDEEVVSDQPYPYISLAEEWKLAHLQSPYVLKRKQGSSSKKTYSSEETAGKVESEDRDDPAVSSSDEQDEDEIAVPSSSSIEEEEEEEDEEQFPQGELEGPPEDYSEISQLPPQQNEESEEQGETNSDEDEEESDERQTSKVPLQALSHVGIVDEDDSTETNLELIPDEVKDAIVREMAKQFAQQARISASKIKKEIKTSKPKRDHIVENKRENDREVVRVTDDHRVTDSDGPYNDEPQDDRADSEKKKPVRDRVTSSDGPYHEGKKKGKGKNKGKGKGKGHGWRPPPKIWHPPPPPQHHHKPHKVRDGLLEQWTRGSQWERILHSYHEWKDQQEHDQKHGHGWGWDGEGPLHKYKPGIAQKLLKGSFWERAFVTYSNYKKQQQNKGGHELAGEGWAPYDR